MKVFAVYADVELSYKPAWLKAFRAKYGKLYPYHITLKQPCYIEARQLPNLKQDLASFFNGFRVPGHAISIEFDTVTADSDDGSIMLVSERGDLLHEMQKELVDALGNYTYYDPKSESREKNFHLHLTIAYDLASELVSQAKVEVHEDDMPSGIITGVTLVVVDNIGPEEATLPENLLHYKL